MYFRQTAGHGSLKKLSNGSKTTRDVQSSLVTEERSKPLARTPLVDGRGIDLLRMFLISNCSFRAERLTMCSRTTVEKDRLGREHMRMNFHV